MPYVRTQPTAEFIARDRLYFLQEQRQTVSVAFNPDLNEDLEIGDSIVLTHGTGVASDGLGFVDKSMLVLGMELISDELAISLRLLLVDLEAAPISLTREFERWRNDPAFISTTHPDATLLQWRTAGEPLHNVTKP